MSTYLKQISADRGLLDRTRFAAMHALIQKEAESPEWDEVGTVLSVRKAKGFYQTCRAMGIGLATEDGMAYTVDVNGAYLSSFFGPMIRCIAPCVNDGTVVAEGDGMRYTVSFEDGKATILCEET